MGLWIQSLGPGHGQRASYERRQPAATARLLHCTTRSILAQPRTKKGGETKKPGACTAPGDEDVSKRRLTCR